MGCGGESRAAAPGSASLGRARKGGASGWACSVVPTSPSRRRLQDKSRQEHNRYVCNPPPPPIHLRVTAFQRRPDQLFSLCIAPPWGKARRSGVDSMHRHPVEACGALERCCDGDVVRALPSVLLSGVPPPLRAVLRQPLVRAPIGDMCRIFCALVRENFLGESEARAGGDGLASRRARS